MKFESLQPFFDELRSERIVIRSYQLEDAEQLRSAVIESRDHLRPWLPFADAHQTLEETQDFIIRCQADILLRKNFSLSIWDAASDEYIGAIGIHLRNWDIPSFEIGYWVRKSKEGHGYITEATRTLCDFMFETWHARRIMIRCDAKNERSAAVPRKLGFVCEGCLRNSEMALEGILRDMLFFSLIDTDPRWNISK